MQGGELRQGCSDDQEIEEMAHCLILLAKGQTDTSQPAAEAEAEAHRCKTCNKSFPSFQALGGHRASHKKPIDEKKSSLMKDDEREFTTLSLKITSTRRVHECSICGAGFLSGQALGGHMRRHRPMPVAAAGGHGESREAKRPKTMPLDLNLPAPQDYDQKESNFSVSTKEQVKIFSASPLINCHF